MKCFSMIYNRYEFILPKNKVDFKGNLGIIKAIYNDKEFTFSLVGVVDKNFNVVLDLFPEPLMPKFDILYDNKIVAILKVPMAEGVYLCNMTNGLINIELDLDALDYEVITKRVLLLKTIIDNIPIMALYDYDNDACLTPYFNDIGEFNNLVEFNEPVAFAKAYFSSNFSNGYIGCYINKLGEIVSNYIDYTTGNEYDKNLNLNEVLEIVNEEKNGYTK